MVIIQFYENEEIDQIKKYYVRYISYQNIF